MPDPVAPALVFEPAVRCSSAERAPEEVAAALQHPLALAVILMGCPSVTSYDAAAAH